MSSQALSKAKSRRAGLQNTAPPPPPTVNQTVEPPKPKMSIPMYLNLLDKRINSLDEKISNSTNLNSIQLEHQFPLDLHHLNMLIHLVEQYY